MDGGERREDQILIKDSRRNSFNLMSEERGKKENGLRILAEITTEKWEQFKDSRKCSSNYLSLEMEEES